MNDASPPPEDFKPPFAASRFDRIAAVFALGLSIAAILVSLVEVSSVREQQRAQAWPYVEISESYSENGFQIRLTNKGVGPALMSAVYLKYESNKAESLDAIILEVLGADEAFSYNLYSSSNPSNTVVAAGESVVLFAVPWEPRTRKFVQIAAGKIDIETCYCSIHDDCWDVSLRAAQTSKSRSCKTGIAP